jgi:DNA-binding transcriptional regulator YdaS (Cro superfamily)
LKERNNFLKKSQNILLHIESEKVLDCPEKPCYIAGMNKKLSPIEKACLIADGQGKLAAILGISIAAVHQWVVGVRKVPAIHCATIEKHTGICRKDLRPDDWQKFWPELADK